MAGYYSDAFRLQVQPPKNNVGTELGKMFMNLGAIADANYKRKRDEELERERLNMLSAWRNAQLESMKSNQERLDRNAELQNTLGEIKIAEAGDMLADKGALAELPNYDSFEEFSKRFALRDPKNLLIAKNYYDQNKSLATDEEKNMIMAGILKETGGVVPTKEQQREINKRLAEQGYYDRYPDAMIKVNDTINQMRARYSSGGDGTGTTLAQYRLWAEEQRKLGKDDSFTRFLQVKKMTGKWTQADLYDRLETELAKMYGKPEPIDFYEDYINGNLTYEDIDKNKKAKQLLLSMARKNDVALKDELPKREYETLEAIRETNDIVSILNSNTDFRDNFGPIDSWTDFVQKYVNLDEDQKDRAKKYFLDAMLKSATVNANIKGIPSNKDMELILRGMANDTYDEKQAAELYKQALEKNLITLKSIERSNIKALPQIIINYGPEEKRINDSIKTIETVFGLAEDKKETPKVIYDPGTQKARPAIEQKVDPADILETAINPKTGERMYKSRRDGKWHYLR